MKLYIFKILFHIDIIGVISFEIYFFEHMTFRRLDSRTHGIRRHDFRTRDPLPTKMTRSEIF